MKTAVRRVLLMSALMSPTALYALGLGVQQVCWKPDGSGINGMDFGWDAVMYDWVHDALTSEERTRYGSRIGRFLRHYTKVPEITLQDGTY